MESFTEPGRASKIGESKDVMKTMVNDPSVTITCNFNLFKHCVSAENRAGGLRWTISYRELNVFRGPMRLSWNNAWSTAFHPVRNKCKRIFFAQKRCGSDYLMNMFKKGGRYMRCNLENPFGIITDRPTGKDKLRQENNHTTEDASYVTQQRIDCTIKRTARTCGQSI